jgi:hypothetical protein
MSNCAKCGAENGEAVKFCQSCGAPQGSQKKIENHLAKAVAALLCCCLPFGVVGLVYAVKVDALLKSGDYAGAEEASLKADLWCNLAIGLGVVANIFVVLLSYFAGDWFSWQNL